MPILAERELLGFHRTITLETGANIVRVFVTERDGTTTMLHKARSLDKSARDWYVHPFAMGYTPSPPARKLRENPDNHVTHNDGA